MSLVPGFSRIGLAAALVLLLSACASKGPQPAKLVEFKPSLELKVAWRASVGAAGRYIFTPAIHQGSVYAAGSRGMLVRLDAKNGKVMWRVDPRAPLSGGVGVGAGMVMVGTAKGAVLAYDLEGKALWNSTVSSEVLSAPQASGNLVVVRSGDSRIYGLNAQDGTRKWEYQTMVPPLTLRSNPGVVIVDNFVIAGMAAGKLVVLNLENGNVIWETVVSAPRGDNELERVSDIAGSPLLLPDRVCAVTFQGRAACYETEKGGQIWGRPASSVGRLAADSRSVYLSEDAGAVLALDKDTGTSFWRQDRLSNRSLSSPVVYREFVVVGDFEGMVHVLSAEDGAFAARISTDGGGIAAAPILLEDKILVQTRKGGLYAIVPR